MLRRALVSTTIALAVSLTACSSDSTPSPETGDEPRPPLTSAPTRSEPTQDVGTMEVRAALAIADIAALTGGTRAKCVDPARTRGIGRGERVELVDANDTVVGVAELEDADAKDALPEAPRHACVWTATFADVPRGGQSYEARLGRWTSQSVAEADLPTQTLVIMAAGRR